MNILDNEKADQAAKKETELQKNYSKYTFFLVLWMNKQALTVLVINSLV